MDYTRVNLKFSLVFKGKCRVTGETGQWLNGKDIHSHHWVTYDRGSTDGTIAVFAQRASQSQPGSL